MRKLVVCEHPIDVTATDEQGHTQKRRGIVLTVLEGVSPQFLADIQRWLTAEDRKDWKELPIIALYHGGKQFPQVISLPVHGYASVSLFNLDVKEE